MPCFVTSVMFQTFSICTYIQNGCKAISILDRIYHNVQFETLIEFRLKLLSDNLFYLYFKSSILKVATIKYRSLAFIIWISITKYFHNVVNISLKLTPIIMMMIIDGIICNFASLIKRTVFIS